MRSVFPPLNSRPRFPLDFSLLPAGILLLELGATLTEIARMNPGDSKSILLLRTIHTLTLFAITVIAKRILENRRVIEVSYIQIFSLGLVLSALSETARMVLTMALDVSHDFWTHRYLIVLVHGLFWIPVFIIVGGRLNQIFSVFKEYEKRLLIKTRIHIRTSQKFKHEQELIENEIRKNLMQEASSLLKALPISDLRTRPLSERNKEIQTHLVGVNLRALSLSLENEAETDSQPTIFGQNIDSLSMLAKQFTLLYRLTAKKSPLSPWVYTFLSTALVAPSFINFFTLPRLLASWPLLFLTTYLLARVNVSILRSNLKNRILLSNLMIVFLGFSPFISNKIGQFISPNPQTSFSFILGGFFFAFGYYLFVRFIQITQLDAISSISNDELEASPALEKAVEKIISQEFAQAVSHRWAIYIHGKILTRLAATSLKLEQSVAINDVDRFDAGIDRIKALLENPTQEFDEGFSDLQSEIASRLDPWEGLISISVSIDPSLASLVNPRVRDCGEAIEEIVSNSVRHGGSQNISVYVTQTTHPDILIHVEDDATKPLPLVVSRVGLGTRILNLVSDGRWTIAHQDRKTTVLITISLLEG